MKDPLRFYAWRCKTKDLEEVLRHFHAILQPVADTIVVNEARDVYRNIPKRISSLDLILRTYNVIKHKCESASTDSVLQIKIWINNKYCYFRPAGIMFSWGYCDLLHESLIDIESYQDFSYWHGDRPSHVDYYDWEDRRQTWAELERTFYVVLDFFELKRDLFIKNYACWVEYGGPIEQRIKKVPKKFKKFFRAVEENYDIKKPEKKAPLMVAKIGSGEKSGGKAELRAIMDEPDDDLS